MLLIDEWPLTPDSYCIFLSLFSVTRMSAFPADAFKTDCLEKVEKKFKNLLSNINGNMFVSIDVREEDMNKNIQIIFAVE